MNGRQSTHLGAFLYALSEATGEYNVNVCAYGGIDIEIGEGEYMRLEWDADKREYVVGPRLT